MYVFIFLLLYIFNDLFFICVSIILVVSYYEIERRNDNLFFKFYFKC